MAQQRQQSSNDGHIIHHYWKALAKQKAMYGYVQADSVIAVDTHDNVAFRKNAFGNIKNGMKCLSLFIVLCQ